VSRWTVQLAFDAQTATPDVDAALRALPGHAGRNLPGSVGGADATWEVVDDDDPTARLGGSVLHAVDACALTPLASDDMVTPLPLIKRTLLLQVRAGTDAATRQRFESELAAMPEHIESIRSWALSGIDQERTPSRWTHAWEQEYATLDGLRRGYMLHPYHWAGVDRWFDPEMPDRIVELDLVHVFYERVATLGS
jgi:Stress responsive A/B Barrel Domain